MPWHPRRNSDQAEKSILRKRPMRTLRHIMKTLRGSPDQPEYEDPGHLSRPKSRTELRRRFRQGKVRRRDGP